MTTLLHITRRQDWQAAQAAGAYRTPSLETEGFIHCSTAAQVLRVAENFYRGQFDLVLLVIDLSRVQPEVKFEAPVNPSTGQVEADNPDLYPHIYGALNLDAVLKVVDFVPGADGHFVLPVF